MEKAAASVKRASALQLRENALQLHRIGHVALDLELAHHERSHAVELTRSHLLPVVPADLDRGVGRVDVGRNIADLSIDPVEHDRALITAEVDLDLLARNPGLAFLHPLNEVLLR